MNNLVVLPTTKKQWKHKADKAIQAHEYEEATEYYQALVDHDVHSYEIHINLLVCFMKIHQLEKAEQYCEIFMDYHQKNYHIEFIEFYIMILYEGHYFSRAMKVIDETIKNEDVTTDFIEKYQEIYSICNELNKPMEQAMLDKLDDAIQTEQHQKQWQILHEWIQLGMQVKSSFVKYLSNPSVHPVLKTKMLEIILTQRDTDIVEIEKFGSYRTIQVNQLLPIKDEMSYGQLQQNVHSLEQDNPTLFALVEELMHQYCYVMYPFQVNEAELKRLSTAFVRVGEHHLSISETKDKYDAKMDLYIENIEICCQLYTHITGV